MADFIPTSMRSLLQPDRNSTNLVLTTFPVPTPNFELDEHLIKVHTVAPCNGELLWPSLFPEPNPGSKQLIPCDDVAGTIVLAPPNSPFKVGDEVYGRTNYVRSGDAREYTIATSDELALKPKNLSWVDAATVPLSSLTAWQALFVQAGLGGYEDGGYRGKRILVTAASGGVGIWLVQLAKLVGAEVVGTCGPANVDFVKSLGAAEVLDYRNTDFKAWAQQEGKKVDIVFDCIGKKSLEEAWWCVKEGGTLISIYQPPEQQKPKELKINSVTNFFFIMAPDGTSLSKISRLVEEGKCKPILDCVFPLEKFEEAFKRLESGHSRGKVVLDLLA
jgi:NADPH:quinone reductase-like Zn-dependent oxidoreductase